jgi:hypothetical protein
LHLHVQHVLAPIAEGLAAMRADEERPGLTLTLRHSDAVCSLSHATKARGTVQISAWDINSRFWG